MPNSIARRAHVLLSATSVIAALFVAAVPASPPAIAKEAPQATGQIVYPDGQRQITTSFRNGVNLATSLQGQKVAAADSQALDTLLRTNLNAKQRRDGVVVKLLVKEGAAGREIINATVDTASSAALRFVRTESGELRVDSDTVRITSPSSQGIRHASGTISGDLAKAAAAAGAPAGVAGEAVKVFATRADVPSEALKQGHFELAYDPGEGKNGALLYAQIEHAGKTYRAWRFKPTGSIPGYFDDSGVRLGGGAAFQEPIPGAKIVSPFGPRKHPVLKVPRFHQGVDYAARLGDPVYASADGTVTDVRWNGNYGKFIRIEHTDRLATTYGHLNGYAAGIKPGSRVRQGDLIGYAGRTGLASGPHLYLELFVDNKRVDPVPWIGRSVTRLASTDIATFEAFKRQVQARDTAAIATDQ